MAQARAPLTPAAPAPAADSSTASSVPRRLSSRRRTSPARHRTICPTFSRKCPACNSPRCMALRRMARKTSVDLARLRRLRDVEYTGPGQRPPPQRRRHRAGRSLDHPAAIDRAHRDHARQQRRGALRRQRGRRRHQHRPEKRCRRPAGDDARRGRRRLVQHAPRQHLGSDQLRAVVDLVLRQRHQVRRLSRQQRAATRRTASATSATRRPTSRRSSPSPATTRSSASPAAARSIPRSGSTSSSPTARGTNTPFDFGNQQGASATAGFTKTIIERRRPDRGWRRA